MEPHSAEPIVLLADNDPGIAAQVAKMVQDIAGAPPKIFTNENNALDWCARHPIHADLVIARESEEESGRRWVNPKIRIQPKEVEAK